MDGGRQGMSIFLRFQPHNKRSEENQKINYKSGFENKIIFDNSKRGFMILKVIYLSKYQYKKNNKVSVWFFLYFLCLEC